MRYRLLSVLKPGFFPWESPVALTLPGALLLFLPISGTCAEVHMRVGNFEESYRSSVIFPKDQLTTSVNHAGPTSCLLFRTLIPDDLENHRYDFEIRADNEIIHRRSGTTRGVGPRSFFIQWTRSTESTGSLALVVFNRAPEPLYVESIQNLPDFDKWLSSPPPSDDFTLSLKLSNKDREHAEMIQEIAKLRSAPGIRKAIGAEIHYAGRAHNNIASKLERLKTACEETSLPLVAVICSWWGGTPQEVFERLEFQQICWSETDTLDEGPALRQLLGSRWDIRYGLTTPNRWSNVPWQTMNHPELNALRAERMSRCVQQTERDLKDHIAAYVIENEPMYWADKTGNDKYPMERRNLQADFNPHTVEAAARLGVHLDPKDGLDLTERTWLHENLSRYMQSSVDSALSAGASRPVYSHMLLTQMFPMTGTGHYRPYGETARVRGGRVGLETLRKTDLDALWRVREWGRWGCVNREENDGHSIEYHLAMLQTQYMMGADLFNSYNWIKINEGGRAIAYFNDFLASVADEGRTVVTGERASNAKRTLLRAEETTWPLNVRSEFPWFNAIELSFSAGAETTQPLELWISHDTSGSVIAYRRILSSEVDLTTVTRVQFGDLCQSEQGRTSMTLHMKSPGGWYVGCDKEGPDYRLLCELRAERRRSQYIMGIGNAISRNVIPVTSAMPPPAAAKQGNSVTNGTRRVPATFDSQLTGF